MKESNKRILSGLLGVVLTVGSVYAEAKGNIKGYITDSSGKIMISRFGECLHSGSWVKADATVVGCDGVKLNEKIEVLKGEATGNIVGITIPAASMFAFDSAVLSDDGKNAIEKYRQTIKPELSNAYTVVVIGHTDSTGADKHNQTLSVNRATSVAEYLISTGLKTDVLRVFGEGSKQPLVSNDTSEGRAINRRVEIFVIAEPRALDAVIFPSVALFERGSGDLSSKGIAMLKKNSQDALARLSRASYVEIIGYTDDVLTGNKDEKYNVNLSVKRAKSVRDYLVSQGLDPNKVFIQGKGARLPITTNATPEGRAQNRRVEILVLGRLK